MKLILLTIIFSTLYSYSFCQSVAINSDGSLPNASAILDVKSSGKGMLLPRTSTSSRLAIVNPAKGLIVYDTTASGFYFYNGSAWSQLSAGSSNDWQLTGNAGTNPANNFMGTTDVQPLRFRVNNSWAGEIHPTSGNVFLGLGSGQANTSGYSNTAIGFFSLYSNTSGSENTALGEWALHFNTTGICNTGIGRNALLANNTGNNNTAGGYRALSRNSSGWDNTAYGSKSLWQNTNGDRNTAHGAYALENNFSGVSNTAIGAYAMNDNSTGITNTATGAYALSSNTTGNWNTAIGYAALLNNTGGDNNIAVGLYSGTHPNTPNVYNTVSIGNDGLLNAYQNQVFLGNNSTGFIGGKVNWGVISDARIKNTIAEDVKGLDFIMRLRPVTYHISNKAMTEVTGNKETPDFPGKYDGEKVKYTGFIAQEVEAAAKAAGYDFSGYEPPKNQWSLYTIRYAEFVVPLVKAMQEQQSVIEELRNQMVEMKKEIELLKKKD